MDTDDEADHLVELAAQVDRGEPDWTLLDQAIESVTNPWEVLRGLLRRAAREWV